MKEIALSRGLVTQVDDEDFENLSAHKWYAQPGSKGNFYAARQIRIRPNKQRALQMHRVLINAPDGLEVDHVDYNGLNNQKENLRLATYAENKRHENLRTTNNSGFKGVSRKGRKWAARICIQEQQIWLGCFDTAVEAAHCYDAAVIKHFGEFAVTNASLCLYPTKPTTL